MLDYEKLYRIIFNGLTDAIECMENEGYMAAKEVLIKAQQAAEDYYIRDGEEDSSIPAVPLYVLPHDTYLNNKKPSS